MWKLIVASLVVAFCPSARANSLSGAVSFYDSDEMSILDLSIASMVSRDFFDDENFQSGLSLSASQRNIENKAVDDEISVLGDSKEISSANFSLGLSQNLTVLSSLRLSVGQGKSLVNEINSSYSSTNIFYGIGYTHWVFNESFRINIELRASSAKSPSKDFTATDGVRVILDSEVESQELRGEVLQIATKETIVNYRFAVTQRSDRPNSYSLGGQIKRYLTSRHAAVHAGYTYYENIGLIKPVTTIGEIVSHAVELSWHQKLSGRYLVTAGYRFYYEQENPREFDQGPRERGSDRVYSSLKYRLKKARWTKDVSSVDLRGGLYNPGGSELGWTLGIGGTYVW